MYHLISKNKIKTARNAPQNFKMLFFTFKSVPFKLKTFRPLLVDISVIYWNPQRLTSLTLATTDYTYTASWDIYFIHLFALT